jgi:pyruvate dehydrogenase E2 component (dihydrolipoamide acetyltransferase)
VAVNVAMPKWGLTMKQGKIVKWFKKEGDFVRKGEELFEVETEKITNKVEAPATGVLFQIVFPEGTTVPVGSIVALIAQPEEHPERIEGVKMSETEEAAAPPEEAAAPPEEAAAPPAEGLPNGTPKEAREKTFVLATPAARRLAKEWKIDLRRVTATGPGGRVTESDVSKYHEEGPRPPKITPLAKEMARQAALDVSSIAGTGEGGKVTKEDVERALEERVAEEGGKSLQSIPFTGMRKAIAENMHASLHNTAQLTLLTEVDVKEMVEFLDLVRKKHANDETVKVSYNDIIILITSRVLKRFTAMNSTLVGEEILIHDAVNMGIAVALPEGLIVPVLHDANKKGLLQIAKEARELARKAREGTLTVDDVTGGTFTITNLSMFEVDGFTPILRPPETGILGVGRIKEKPAVYGGEIAIRPMMFISLTFDHRVVDGAPAAEFLQSLAQGVQHPTLIMT